jgi:hypothetical protein
MLWRAREEEEDKTNVQNSLWSWSDDRLMAPFFSITFTVASFTTIPPWIMRAPTTMADELGPDKE